MALPSSGQLSFSAIYTEFVNGGCIGDTVTYFASALALAQNPFYSYGNTIYVSQFYSSACPKGGGK